jgi:hypothetical protein
VLDTSTPAASSLVRYREMRQPIEFGLTCRGEAAGLRDGEPSPAPVDVRRVPIEAFHLRDAAALEAPRRRFMRA